MGKHRVIIVLLVAFIPLLGSAEVFRTRLHQLHTPTHSQSDVLAEIEFGRKVAAHVLGREDLLKDPNLTRYVTLIGRSLAMHSPRNELEFHFGVLRNDAINAYSTPGGYVFITTGALKFVQDESELAAVLAHEIAHINSRHIVKELNIHGTESDNLSTIARVVSASSETTRVAANQAIDSAMTLLFDQGYKIKDEIEADQEAMLMLAITGYDPMALTRYLKRVDKHMEGNPGEKTPTHPSSQQRFARMHKLAQEEHLTTASQLRTKKRFSNYISKE
ncbi:M48 family metalloprotease [Kaarinaea lacus]